ncbi:glycine/sarcosine/betaine reductase component B subunit [Gemella cuniculi]|uniref:glycine/sarcosine/betaine reductase component B subunit n=1 Tax=Gemella cuniculi TaxID=150240 RepID=UPI00041453F9|nr:glycine/sarcosine/betaine reductase component B subunit [Gemella cuniculi]
MTTKHHYNCPVVSVLSKDKEVEFTTIIVGGVSENFDNKVFTAKRIADIANTLNIDGALVAIDGWGNHHIDFVSAIEELGKKDITSVGLSFIGRQGRLVCTNNYVDCIVDFNKGTSGYESCVVGENNLTEYDAMKAIAILKSKLRKKGRLKNIEDTEEYVKDKLIKKIFKVNEVMYGNSTYFENGKLILEKNLEKKYKGISNRIKDIKIKILKPSENDFFVNSNLDYLPIACKKMGELGSGQTHELSGVCVMITGVEDKSGYQPANIGSSEGIFKNQVFLDRAGTPASTDYIIHVDFLFEEGEGRSSEGVIAAHNIADLIVEEIRKKLLVIENFPYRREEYFNVKRPNKSKIALIKLVSGLGNMYDTMVFPKQPGGIIGAYNLRNCQNIPYVISPNQCRDGVIHSLL